MVMRIRRPRSSKDRGLLEAAWPGIEASIRAGMAAAEAILRAEVDRLASADPPVPATSSSEA
jgi:hypothetical protein